MSQKHSHSVRNLKIAFFLNLFFTVIELVGGLLVNSIAIISDAIHDLGDSLSLGTAWYLEKKSKRGKDPKFSFGYARFSLLGAMINSLILIGGSVYVVSEAIGRFKEPTMPDAKGMIYFAVGGILINGYAAWKLSSGKSLNERVVSWHLLEDVLGWVAVLIVAIILRFKHIPILDPALSVLITLYILWGAIKRLRETLFVFLQGVPASIDLEKIKREITQVQHVQSLHHTHVWSLEGENHVFTTHVKLEDIDSFHQIIKAKGQIKDLLSRYPFSHYTVETELDDESCNLD